MENRVVAAKSKDEEKRGRWLWLRKGCGSTRDPCDVTILYHDCGIG